MGKGRGLALAGMLFLVSVQPLTAFAGSINGNEQELLNVISGTETYNGRTYRMKEEYIAQARAYFLQDGVDITDEQKQEALASMYSSIGQGIAEGYLFRWMEALRQEEIPAAARRPAAHRVPEAGILPGADQPVRSREDRISRRPHRQRPQSWRSRRRRRPWRRR